MSATDILAACGGLMLGILAMIVLTGYIRAVARSEAGYVAATTPYEQPPETPPAERLQAGEPAP